MKTILILALLAASLTASSQWKFTGNKAVTGGLFVLAGSSKGFNETLMFHYSEFQDAFPGANRQWFDPSVSWRNKYQNGDPLQGAKFPGSTTVFVAFTDQYHLNNMIHRLSITSAMVIKLGEKQKWWCYVIDFAYYTLCYQAGFAASYYPFKK